MISCFVSNKLVGTDFPWYWLALDPMAGGVLDVVAAENI